MINSLQQYYVNKKHEYETRRLCTSSVSHDSNPGSREQNEVPSTKQYLALLTLARIPFMVVQINTIHTL